MILRFLLALAITVLLMSKLALAEQRALLVGVGKYAAPGNDLPGIDLDVERMQDTLNVMGFEDSQIRILLHEQSTAANVIAEISSWLTDGVQATDRVVFYYSGHGSFVPDFDGDESDGVDEVLVTHDAHRVVVDGRASLEGVVRDDVLYDLLREIPSRNILTIVDACHSGTTTRSFHLADKSLTAEPVFTKAFVYEGMPEGKDLVFSRSFGDAESASDFNFVSISAADDNEKAIGTSAGGVFTIGLSAAIVDAAKANENVTLLQLKDRASSYIQTKLSNNQVHHPQVTGNPDLASGSLEIIPLAGGIGPNRKKLLEMVDGANADLGLGATQSTYIVDESVELLLDIPPGGGYLNIVAVDTDDTATVIFPNQLHPDNAVSAGQIRIPSNKMTFTLPAAEPAGATLVAAFVTQDAINFHEQALEGRDASGRVTVAFTTLSPTATRAIRLAPKREQMYAAKLELNIVGSQQ